MSSKPRIAVVGNFPPRRCGIATFTADVVRSLGAAGAEVSVIAVSDGTEDFTRVPEVEFVIDQHTADDYAAAARFINAGNFHSVLLQHEYGIFGGDDGEFVLGLLRPLNAPISVTCHTILAEPTPGQRSVLAEITQLSEMVVTMSHRGETMLHEGFGVPHRKIRFVFHGIPVTPHPPRLVAPRHLMTFGLIGPDKGIEYAIGAMPAVLDRHPDIRYRIVGATHPHLLRTQGETYRESLRDLVASLGIGDAVEFIDEFVDGDRLHRLLTETDIYITPYLKPNQITSGTLSYAFGMGKAVVSTPYWHAEELLAEGRGILVPFRDSQAIANAVIELGDNLPRLHAMQAAAYVYGRQMEWPAIGQRYREICEESIRRAAITESVPAAIVPDKVRALTVPARDLRHLQAMTDTTGIVQHATYAVPNRHEGYCTDDNARAAVLSTRLHADPAVATEARRLLGVYLSFLDHAVDRESGQVRNFISFDRQWREARGSDDSVGRCVWALGVVANHGPAGYRERARELFDIAYRGMTEVESPRAVAFAILGLVEMAMRSDGEGYAHHAVRHAQILARRYELESDSNWRWFESSLTYDNARLPEALYRVHPLAPELGLLRTARESLRWLVTQQRDAEGRFAPIGSGGFYERGRSRAMYDQQPLEAAATIDACLAAYAVEPDPYWMREVHRAYAWFLGENIAQQTLYDPESGGCCDGVTPMGLNRNQGAESLLAWLSATESVRPILAPESANLSPQLPPSIRLE